MLNKIIECENRILQDRKLLNDLLQECELGNTSELTRAKIDELQRELNFMNYQLDGLRREYSRQTPMPSPAMQQQRTPAPDPVMQYQQAPQQVQAPNSVPIYPYQEPEKKDVEKTIGKSLMGICASVLIFVSLILFATLVLPYMSDTVKQILMFAVSFVFAIVGNVLLVKDRKNKWFLSLAGCGVGAVYVSLLVSRLYFNAINDIVLYICIFIWAVVVCVLSRLRSQVFLVIGQAGVLISVFFGVLLCSSIGDGNRVLFLVIYFLLAEVVFYVSHIQREYGKNLLNHVFGLVCMLMLLFVTNPSHEIGEVRGVIASVLLAVIACVLVWMSILFFEVRKRDEVGFGLINVLYLIITACSFIAHFPKYNVGAIVMLVLTIGFLTGLELRYRETEEVRPEVCAGKRIFQVALFIALLFEVAGMDFVMEYSSLALPALGCLLYGFFKNQKAYKVAGITYAACFVLDRIHNYLYLLWGVVIFAAIIILIYRYKEQYQTWLKLVSYLIFFSFVITCENRIMGEFEIINGEMRSLLRLALLAAINICMMKVPALGRNLCTRETETSFGAVTGVIHVLQMFVALDYISTMDALGYHLLAIMLGLVLFVVNIRNVLKKFNYKWSSIYVGTKVFIFFCVILGSFDAPDYWFSVVALLFAIAFIVVGFFVEMRLEKKIKSLRVYGLVLSLISIVKLLLLDIHYDNVVSLAVSFFVSGLLCFVISFIYNWVDKRIMAVKPERKEE